MENKETMTKEEMLKWLEHVRKEQEEYEKEMGIPMYDRLTDSDYARSVLMEKELGVK